MNKERDFVRDITRLDYSDFEDSKIGDVIDILSKFPDNYRLSMVPYELDSMGFLDIEVYNERLETNEEMEERFDRERRGIACTIDSFLKRIELLEREADEYE